MKTSATRKVSTTALVIVAGFLLLPPATGFAQVSDEQLSRSLQLARTSLQQLDSLAGTCLEDSAGSASCTEFNQALDGEVLTTYLDNCAVARRWREEFVTRQMQDSTAAAPADENHLQSMIAIEYLCGENALARTTEHVLPAYRNSSDSRASASTLARSLQYQLDSSRQSALIEQQRRRLDQEFSIQQERSHRQTQQQFDRLELELIRQQNTRTYPY